MFEFQTLLSVFGVLPELVILVVAIVYLSRTKRTDAKLLFFGSLVHVIVRFTYLLIPMTSFFQYDADNARSISRFYGIVGVVSFSGSVLFCIGLVMLVQFAMAMLVKKST